jgi:hypothetical protein
MHASDDLQWRNLWKGKGMSAFLQLWDKTTGNLATELDLEDEAIEALGDVHAEEGQGPLLRLALFRFTDDRPNLIAKERDLVAYVARARAQSLTTATGG